MQFSLSGGGTPSTAKDSLANQAKSIKGNADEKVGPVVDAVISGLNGYLDAQEPTASVSVSVSVYATVSPGASAK